MNAISVALFSRLRIEAITSERFDFEKTSAIVGLSSKNATSIYRWMCDYLSVWYPTRSARCKSSAVRGVVPAISP